MAEELEKTCENCKYEYEDMEGTHCRHCIHNAEENFEPKEKTADELEAELKFLRQWKSDVMNDFCKYDASSVEEIAVHARNRAIDEFTKQLRPLLITCTDRLRLDEMAKQLKGGDK